MRRLTPLRPGRRHFESGAKFCVRRSRLRLNAARPESAPYQHNLIYRAKVDVSRDLPGGYGEKRTDERFGTSLK